MKIKGFYVRTDDVPAGVRNKHLQNTNLGCYDPYKAVPFLNIIY
jgi:hypothetical protein